MKNSDLVTAALLILSLLTLADAEIKSFKISADTRPLILFEKFAFTSNGVINVVVTDATFSSADPSLAGFFLVSDSNIIQTLYQLQNPNPNPNPNSNPCILSSPYIRLLFTFLDLSPPPFNSYNRSFPISLADHYTLFFANCNPDSDVSMAVVTSMYNSLPDGSRDYLPVGEAPVPSVCFAFALAYLAFLAIWIQLGLVKNRTNAHQIHYLMAGLLVAKALNLFFKAEDQHYVRITGTPHGWAVLFYLFQFIKGILLFTVIVLIGTGWSFLKPFLQDREKKVLMLVIPLQVITNVASVVIGENGPSIQDWAFWTQVFLLVDVVCCCAILFPIVWSIRSLRETSKTDGKARRNLAKLVLFRKFYVVLVGYLYFTRVVVFALETILSYKWSWASVAADEGVTLAFYVLMFYMFRPKEKNEYFALNDEEEAAAAMALKDGEFDI